MNNTLRQVQEFHQVFDHPIGNLTDIELLKVRQLRIKLLFEELTELAEASDCRYTLSSLCAEHLGQGAGTDGDNVNKLEELDACCDLQYVLNGKIITAGLQNVFDANFDRVHQNNMSKAHSTYEQALETKNKNRFTNYNIKPKDGGLFILTNADGKIIKPHDHVKVALSLTL